jgi:hypothetical protein
VLCGPRTAGISFTAHVSADVLIKHTYQALDHGTKMSPSPAWIFALTERLRWLLAYQQKAPFCGRPAIYPNERGNLRVIYEDTARQARIQADYDMVVLANAVQPPESLPELATRLAIDLDADGFIQAREVQGGLVMT